jgi:hypothetical protein
MEKHLLARCMGFREVVLSTVCGGKDTRELNERRGKKKKVNRHGTFAVFVVFIGTQCRSKMLLIVIYARSFYCLLPLHACVESFSILAKKGSMQPCALDHMFAETLH